MTKYILETWPEIQQYMHHPRWNECIYCTEIDGHPCPDSAYMIPESLYNEINSTYNEQNSIHNSF